MGDQTLSFSSEKDGIVHVGMVVVPGTIVSISVKVVRYWSKIRFFTYLLCDFLRHDKTRQVSRHVTL